MCRKDMAEEYKGMSQLVQNGRIHLFKNGGYPALMSNAEVAAEVITDFFSN